MPSTLLVPADRLTTIKICCMYSYPEEFSKDAKGERCRSMGTGMVQSEHQMMTVVHAFI